MIAKSTYAPTAAEARNMTTKATKETNAQLLKEIYASIVSVAKSGFWSLTHQVPRNCQDVVTAELERRGYTVKRGAGELQITWRW